KDKVNIPAVGNKLGHVVTPYVFEGLGSFSLKPIFRQAQAFSNKVRGPAWGSGAAPGGRVAKRG
ncbi:MAG: hypothetical protein PVI71_11685, partial [Desulfobacterales bacterium]